MLLSHRMLGRGEAGESRLAWNTLTRKTSPAQELLGFKMGEATVQPGFDSKPARK